MKTGKLRARLLRVAHADIIIPTSSNMHLAQDLSRLPTAWRPTWRYCDMIFTLVNPLPEFALRSTDDAFWEEMMCESLLMVIQSLRARFRRLQNATLGVSPHVLAFAYQKLSYHALVVEYLLDESERVDWDTICDIIPEGTTNWNKASVAAYLRGPATKMWKLRILHWYTRAHVKGGQLLEEGEDEAVAVVRHM